VVAAFSTLASSALDRITYSHRVAVYLRSATLRAAIWRPRVRDRLGLTDRILLMRFLLPDETRDWCRRTGVLGVNDQPMVQTPDMQCRRFDIRLVTGPRCLSLARQFSCLFSPADSRLLWVTLSGIWPSSENLHLYYRLRQSYGDLRLLQEAPGHYYLPHETEDFSSFSFVGLVNGWDMFLFDSQDSARVFVSHDGWFDIALRDSTLFDEVREVVSVQSGS
jgi:hypothetical protein